MLYRKITSYIEDYLKSDTDKILILEGARQIGKSFSIREAGARLYPNYVEINFVEDDEGDQLFKNIHKKEDFYLTLSMVAGDRLSSRDDTLVFLDEIQHYPQYLTMSSARMDATAILPAAACWALHCKTPHPSPLAASSARKCSNLTSRNSS